MKGDAHQYVKKNRKFIHGDELALEPWRKEQPTGGCKRKKRARWSGGHGAAAVRLRRRLGSRRGEVAG